MSDSRASDLKYNADLSVRPPRNRCPVCDHPFVRMESRVDEGLTQIYPTVKYMPVAYTYVVTCRRDHEFYADFITRHGDEYEIGPLTRHR